MSTDEQPKLNSMRLLDQRGTAYEVFTYDPSIRDGVSAAEAMGQPVEQVFKTLVVQLKGGEFALVMVPVKRTLDLKRFARAIGLKKATMTTRRGAEAATGLKKGGIGALALTHKRWGVYLDQAAEAHDTILVNAGQRGVNLKLKVADLVDATNALVIEITDPVEGESEAPTDPETEGDTAKPTGD